MHLWNRNRVRSLPLNRRKWRKRPLLLLILHLQTQPIHPWNIPRRLVIPHLVALRDAALADLLPSVEQ